MLPTSGHRVSEEADESSCVVTR